MVQGPLYWAVRELVATKRYNDARSLIEDAAAFSRLEVAPMFDHFHITDADLERYAQESRERHGDYKDWVQRAKAKREQLRVDGAEPTMRQVATALAAEKDYRAAQVDVIHEAFTV